MAAKIVKTLTIAGVLADFEILEGVPDFGESRERIDVTTLTDMKVQKRNHPLPEYKDVTFKVADKGTRPDTTDTAVKVTITATDPSGTQIAQREYMAEISDVTPETINVGSNRVPAYSVTISPTGENVAAPPQQG
jgi:hypothetical protein